MMSADKQSRIGTDFVLLTRREFLGSMAGGLVVLMRPPILAGAEAVDDQPLEAWLHLGADGIATGFTGKVEYGQGIRTGFAQVIAEELDLPLDRVRIVMGDTDRVPFDAGTYASLSTEMMRPRFQRAAARARVLLQRRAAQRWNVPEDQARLQDGQVHGPAGQSIELGMLIADAPLIDVLEYEPESKPISEQKWVGKDIPRIDGIERVTGAAVYGTDLTSPEMLHGAVLRSPTWGARLISVDVTQAESAPGVVRVVRKGDFVGVVAQSESAAHAAVGLLKASWQAGPEIKDSIVREQLHAACSEATLVHEQGDELRAWGQSRQKLEATYETSFVYHAALEPQAAWAKVDAGEVWIQASTQRPFGVRQEVAQLLKVPETKVHVTVSEIGGGFGRKNDTDAAIEAVLLAEAVGRPVRVVWSRDEDFTQSSFRPSARMEVKAGIDDAGNLVAWDYCLAAAGGHFSSTRDVQSYYPSDFHRTRFALVPSGVRVGSFRGLGSPINAFARESFMDELAHAVGIDPLTFRLRTLGNRMPRLTAVLRAAVERSGWKPQAKPSGTGHGFGLACCLYRDKTYVAQVAEVHVDQNGQAMKVDRVFTAIDCGSVVNPDGVRKQAEGGVTMATSYSLGEAVRIEQSTISNASFGRYRILRMEDAPHVETIIVGGTQNPSVGVGEPVTVPVAAALANARFDATGVRTRKLPLL